MHVKAAVTMRSYTTGISVSVVFCSEAADESPLAL